MILKDLENKIGADWIKEQQISFRFTKNYNYKQLRFRNNRDSITFSSLYEWELNKCQQLNLVDELGVRNILGMLNSKNESDHDLGRLTLNNLRKQRLKHDTRTKDSQG